MKYVVTVPENIVFYTISIKEGVRTEKPAEEPPFPFSTFICDYVTNDTYFSKAPTLWEAAVDLVKQFKNAKPGDVVVLADSEYRHLKSAVESPSVPYGNMHMMKQLIPFARAILDAEKEEDYEKRMAREKKQEAPRAS